MSAETPRLDPRFIIHDKGRDLVRLAGLMDLAHQLGLQSIATSIAQLPGPENAQTAVVQALVTLADGRLFSSIGDANPDNVSRMMVPHTIRMAESRAIARALRWATNIAAVAVEELADLDEQPDAAPKPPKAKGRDWQPSAEQKPTPTTAPASSSAPAATSSSKPAAPPAPTPIRPSQTAPDPWQICADCGHQIQAATVAGVDYTAEHIAARTLAKIKRTTCNPCYQRDQLKARASRSS